MGHEISDKVKYWCCILGRPLECNMDCSNCNQVERGTSNQSTSTNEEKIKYLDIDIIKGNS
jgi:hypothetical protein